MITHYDANDDHQPLPNDVLDPDEINDISDRLEHSNIVYIHGIAYALTAWTPPRENGTRAATLTPYEDWKPF